MLYLLLFVDAWLAGLVITHDGPTTGVAIPFVLLTALLGHIGYHAMAYDIREGLAGRVTFGFLLEAGFVPQDSHQLDGYPGAMTMFRESDGLWVLLAKTPDLREAYVATGHLADPFTFEESATWRIRTHNGVSAVPKSLLAQLGD